MRFSVLGNFKLSLARGAALLVLGGLTAGCSSGAGRFTDGLMTSSTTQAPQQTVSQPEPDLVAPEETYSISDSRSAVPSRSNVQRSSLPPVAGTTQSNQPFQRASAPPAEEPVQTAAVTRPSRPAPVIEKAPVAARPAIDPLSRSVERGAGVQTAEVERKDPAGWSSAGGSQITAKDGETVFNLARRYGVPAKVLMQVNDIDESGALRAGQKVRIPVYVYSDRAPVSAPDNDPKVANSKSSRGLKEPNDPKRLPVDAPKQAAVLPQTSKQRANGGVYVVEPGDSLLGIARDNGTTMAAIRTANGLKDNNVRIGQALKMPGAGGSVVTAAAPKSAETVKAAVETKPKANVRVVDMKPKSLDATKTASTEPAPKKKELAAAQTEEAKVVQASVKAEPAPITKAVAEVEKEDDSAAPSGTGIGKMRWPAKGRVTGSGKGGIEIQVPEGTPVKAAENGVVIYAGNGLKDYGNTVLVRHDNGLVTVYGNASELNVKRGQKVRRGEEIAKSGMSGNAESPKLHFEVRKDASPVDPRTFLE